MTLGVSALRAVRRDKRIRDGVLDRFGLQLEPECDMAGCDNRLTCRSGG